MKNSNFVKNSILALLPISLSLGVIFGVGKQNADFVSAYEYTKLDKMNIDLNDVSDDTIRTYYAALNDMDDSQKKGNNLLKNLKPILRNEQKYFSYDSTGKDSIWKLYEITDRDWIKSPASSLTNGTYDSISNKIYDYQFGVTTGSDNPYIHALYVDRSADNQTRAWGDHSQGEFGINQEHIWAKSHGFDTLPAGESGGGARGDPMHLWAGNGYANNIHSNDYFGYVDKSKEYKNTKDNYPTLGNNLHGTSRTLGSGTVFEPQDSDKGDIARALFYMAARYNNFANEDFINGNEPNLILDNDINLRTGTSGKNDPFDMGVLDDLLEWNKIDPPDEYEIHRNNLLFNNFTFNRNPFIDFPDWADICFGVSSKSADPKNDRINGKADPSEPTLQSIALSGNYKTEFKTGEEFSSEGLVVTASYSDGSTKVVTPTKIDGYDKNKSGEQTIKVSYREGNIGVEATYKVVVKKSALTILIGIGVGIVVVIVFISSVSASVHKKNKRKGKKKNGRK